MTAVSLSIGSAPDSPLRFIFEPNAGTMATLPWAMIPGFLVPIYILSHLAVFASRRVGAPNDGRRPQRITA